VQVLFDTTLYLIALDLCYHIIIQKLYKIAGERSYQRQAPNTVHCTGTYCYTQIRPTIHSSCTARKSKSTKAVADAYSTQHKRCTLHKESNEVV
jgi:hypothetical protein